MAAKKKCELWLGTSTSFFRFGEFESISDAKKYVRDCVDCYHEIRPIEKTISEKRDYVLSSIGI
jgi:hypothetical protein